MVVSSKDNRFNEWLKCFEVLFDVTADQIMADYNELVSFYPLPISQLSLNNRKWYKNGINRIIRKHQESSKVIAVHLQISRTVIHATDQVESFYIYAIDTR